MNTVMFWFILAVVFLALIFSWRGRRSDRKGYDERQALFRGKGFCYGFFTVVICNMLFALLDGIPIDKDAALIVSGFLGVGVYIVYCSWKDAYLQMGEAWKRDAVFFAAIGLLDVYNGVRSIQRSGMLEKGRFTMDGVNLLAGILFLLVAAILILRRLSAASGGGGDEE